jgi:protoporphyrinogen oxidase
VVTWTPDRHLPFFRLTEATWSMPWLAPAGKTTINADIGCEVGDAIWTMPEEQLAQLCLEHLEALVPAARQRYLGCRVMRTPIAHPVFLRQYETERLALESSTSIDGLYSIGRNGEFAHILMEDVYWRTLRHMRGLIAAL